MKRLLKTLLTLALIIAAGLAARQYLASAVRILGTSMENTLVFGDIALVLRFDRSPDYGNVIECRFPGRDGSYVKRVIGLPGDTVESADGLLFRNGKPVSEPYISSAAGDFRMTVNENEIFVLGDNRAESYDSRAEDMGCINEDDCLGRACWILWPIDRFGPIE